MHPVKRLLTYRYAEMIYHLTVDFTHAYLRGNLSSLRNLSLLGEKADFRTIDQMTQAARSGKQNIIEGVSGSETSKSGEIKLLGVSKASFEELLADYEDFLRQNDLEIYPKDHPKVESYRKRAYFLSSLSNLSNLGELKEKPKLSGKPEDDANILLTLCHLLTFLLDKQIKSALAKFEKEGGTNEKLYRIRLKHLKGDQQLKSLK